MSSQYIGEIRMFGGNFAPIDWALCNGQTIAIDQNPALFQLIGTTYGGDGQQTFQLPNLQSRIPVHQGQGLGLSTYVMGEVLGSESITLNTQQMPNHSHAAQASTDDGTQSGPGGNLLAASGDAAMYTAQPPNVSLNAAAVGNAGGSQPHENVQPFLVVNFIIALFGIFPTQ
jgi:microcystin-dependent protein